MEERGADKSQAGSSNLPLTHHFEDLKEVYDMSKRAYRIHHKKRMVSKALRSRIIFNMFYDYPQHLIVNDHYQVMKTNMEKYIWAKKISDNIHFCSCEMCGNPRKYYKGKHRLSRQETRGVDSYEYQLERLNVMDIRDLIEELFETQYNIDERLELFGW